MRASRRLTTALLVVCLVIRTSIQPVRFECTTGRVRLTLAILGAILCLYSIAIKDTWGIIAYGGCAVLFGLQAAGYELFPGIKILRRLIAKKKRRR